MKEKPIIHPCKTCGYKFLREIDSIRCCTVVLEKEAQLKKKRSQDASNKWRNDNLEKARENVRKSVQIKANE